MSYRILSLDGGGSWALIEVKALIELYGADTRGRAVLNDFDLVAANSGGSIVLGALLEDLPLSQTLALFNDETRRRSIFSKTSSLTDRVLHDLTGLGPKYSAENKLPALQRVLPRTGTQSLPQAVVGLRRPGASEDLHLVIVSFDYDRRRAAFFRSSTASTTAMGTGDVAAVTLSEAIHASTNAPVNYFDLPACFPDRTERYWDGAITGYNNPLLAGVTEAIVKGAKPTDIVALSLGTGTIALPYPKPGAPSSPYLRQLIKQSFVSDLHSLATAILDDPPDMATFLAHVMTGADAGLPHDGPKSRIVRMSPLISPVHDPQSNDWIAPGPLTAAQFTYLTKLDMDAIDQHEVDVIAEYADLWIGNVAPNQPVRMDGDTLACELGQSSFQAARAAWDALK